MTSRNVLLNDSMVFLRPQIATMVRLVLVFTCLLKVDGDDKPETPEMASRCQHLEDEMEGKGLV